MQKDQGGQGLLWIVDDVLALVGLILFIFSLYIIPHVFFDFTYPIPDFVFGLNQWLMENYGLRGMKLRAVIFLLFFIGCIVLLVISKIMTSILERQQAILEQEGAILPPSNNPPPGEIQRMVPTSRPKVNLLLLLIGIILLAFVVFWLFLFG